MTSLQPPFSPEHLAAVKQYRKIEDLLPSHWSESEVSANGLRHHYYRTGGEKPQLVLLHGFQESAICWLRVAKVLGQDYDLLLIDARGHGLSDRAGPAFTPQLLTEDAAGVIQALKLDRPHLLGFSMGGYSRPARCHASRSGAHRHRLRSQRSGAPTTEFCELARLPGMVSVVG
jgi:Alpha/beta hydrolase family